MSGLAWFLAIGACYRCTLLIVADEITRPPREWLLRRLGPEHRVSYLISCAWCSSAWVALAAVESGHLWGDRWWWQLAAGALTASGITGAAARYAAPD